MSYNKFVVRRCVNLADEFTMQGFDVDLQARLFESFRKNPLEIGIAFIF